MPRSLADPRSPSSRRWSCRSPALGSTVSLHRFALRPEGADPAPSPRELPLRIVADSSHRVAALRHVAAFRAVAELRGDSVVLHDEAAGEGWIVWLTDSVPAAAVLENVSAGATLLMPARGGGYSDEVEIEPFGQGRILRARFADDPAVDATFPELIARIWPEPASLAPGRPPVRRLSTSQLLPSVSSAARRPASPRTPLGKALLGLALLAFLVERWLSNRPVQPRGT